MAAPHDLDLVRAMTDAAADIERQLDLLLPSTPGDEQRLHDAMRYSALGGGKRLRPFLTLECAKLFKVAPSAALRVAAAVEMVHSYSLIHDDLPAMDDSDTRRGRPSVHIAFDEATAILAGDALLTRAFEVLTDPAVHGDGLVRIDLVREMAQAAGAAGMCGGQMLDLLAPTMEFDIGATTRLQRLKTGEMIAFACSAGATLGKAPAAARAALNAYAHDLGLAFQIADDLLDVEGDSRKTGKPTGQDEGKATFVSLLGLDRARAQAQLLSAQAIAHLDMFAEKADLLKALARWVVSRSR